MTVTITTAAASQPLNVLGEQLRPLTPGRAQHRGFRDHRAGAGGAAAAPPSVG